MDSSVNEVTEVESLLKTFGRWSSHLLGLQVEGEDVLAVVSDGRNLLRLVELLSGESIGKPGTGQSTYHKLENINRCIQYLNRMGALSRSVRPESILNADPLAVTELVWDLVNHYLIQTVQLKDVIAEHGQPLTLTSRNPLLLWAQLSTTGCSDTEINNFGSCWSDGHALTTLIRRHCPRPDREATTNTDPAHTLNRALQSAQLQLGVPTLIQAQDVIGKTNRKCLMTYLSVFYHTLRHHRMSQPLQEVTRIQITQRDQRPVDQGRQPVVADAQSAPVAAKKEEVEQTNGHEASEKPMALPRQRLLPEAKFISDFLTVKRMSKGRREGSIVHTTTQDVIQARLQVQTPIVHSDHNGLGEPLSTEPLLTEPTSTDSPLPQSFSTELMSIQSLSTELNLFEPLLTEPKSTDSPSINSFSNEITSNGSFSTELQSIQSLSLEPNLSEPLLIELPITKTTLPKPLLSIPLIPEPLWTEPPSNESSTLTKLDVLHLLERMNRLESVVNRLEKDNQQLRDRLESTLDSVDDLVLQTQDEKRRLQRSVQSLIVTSKELQHRIDQLHDSSSSNHVDMEK